MELTLKSLVETYQQLTRDTYDFEKFNSYAIVHHSNAIEGSSLSLEETRLLLDENLTPGGKPLADSLMAKDHLNALQDIMRLADQKKKIELHDLQRLSALILHHSHGPMHTAAGNFDPSKGDFRTVKVVAGTATFAKPEKIVGLCQLLLEELKSQIDRPKSVPEIYRLSYSVHYQLVNIHPFLDGNGRLSRLLMNYVQHYHQLPLSLVNSADKVAYIQSLNASRKKGNIQPFLEFMDLQTQKYFKAQIKILNKKTSLGKKGPDGITLLF